MSGIDVKNTAGVTINGTRCGLVSDIACDDAVTNTDDAVARMARRLQATPGELAIAKKAHRLLEKMRSKGYTPEATRAAFVRKITDEAQRVSLQTEQEQESNAVREG